MNTDKVQDLKETALNLEEIKNYKPEEYFYLKGWIHCLLQQKQNTPTPPTIKAG